ncbi:MAG: histidinol dehydrogenase [Rhodospirillaceae bacterium]|nr:histidinol dehydrogenase [Rhodospirillaceae bacterium]|tara:strand:+ start:3021 stop:4340 length:1320 start_codon:yes stop_codon:yes gene_type:complete
MTDLPSPRLLHLAALSAAERAALCARGLIDVGDYLDRARPIVEAVRDEGDVALVRFAGAFDKVTMAAEQIRVAHEAFEAAYNAVPDAMVAAIREAAENIRAVHAQQKPPRLDMIEVRPGVMAGDRYVPIEAVACYVPRGKGSFPSVTLMTAIPAKVAGVPRIVVITPPGPDGTCDAGTLVAAREAGVSEVYLAGGAQGVAAVAYGTETVPRCSKIVGPGSPWIGAAMELCAEAIATGPPAGPSESMVLADGTADPDRLALDLLVEAEHGDDSTTFLVTWDETLARATAERIEHHLWSLSEERRFFAATALGVNGGLLVAADRDDALAFVNEFAAEHLQIASTVPHDYLDAVTNAGEVLLGQDAPFSMANFMIGVNAVLPTGGKAATHSALGVMDYIKRQSIAELTPEGYDALANQTETFARYEGFDAHALAIAARRNTR